MSSSRGFKAEKTLSVLSKVLSSFCMTAHADEGSEPTGGSDNGVKTPQINYEQLIAQARKEEKEKLYPRIKKLEDDNASHIKTINDNLIKIGDLTQTVNNLTAELAAYKSGEKETKEVKALKEQIATLTAENEKLKNETPNVEQLRAEIAQEYEIKSYLAEQKAANKDIVLSSFIDEISGTTKEEIDASVTSAKEKSIAIKKELGLVDDEGNPITNKKSSGKGSYSTSKKANAKAPAMNPTEDTGTSTVTFDSDYIRNLDPSSEEYKEFRKSLGLK